MATAVKSSRSSRPVGESSPLTVREPEPTLCRPARERTPAVLVDEILPGHEVYGQRLSLRRLLVERVEVDEQQRSLREREKELDAAITKMYQELGITRAKESEQSFVVALDPWTNVCYPIDRIRQEFALRQVDAEVIGQAIQAAKKTSTGESVVVRRPRERRKGS